jgi:peptidylprolyl isomerase
MSQAKNGDSVTVHYTGRLTDGTVFDSSEGEGCGCEHEPLSFTIGHGEVIPGFEQAVIGMSIGESRTVTIPVDEAYGERSEQMVAVIDKGNLPTGMTPAIGQQLEVSQENGQTFPVIVCEVTDDKVTLDANHPLAGHDLTFDIRLLTIN